MRTEDSPPLAIRIRNFERYIEKTVKEALSPLKAYDEAAVKQDGAVHKTMKAVADLNPIVGIYNGGNYAFGDKTTMFGEEQSGTSATAGFVLSSVPGAFLMKWSGKVVMTGGKMIVNNVARVYVTKSTANGLVGISSSILKFTSKQLQSKFKHAADFGIIGNYTKANAGKFSAAVNKHINSVGIKIISGTYKGENVVHYLNPSTGVNVISTPSGQFISGWKLGSGQLQGVLKNGTLW